MVDGETSSNDGAPPPDRQTQSPTSSSVEIGVKCDIWSVGIVLYVLLSGAHPFDLDGRQPKDQIVQNILLGKFTMSDESTMWSSISREAKGLLTILLEVDPEKRPTAAQALEHKWFACPHTPRTPLAVSVSDGLGHYQRLMRKKFRVSRGHGACVFYLDIPVGFSLKLLSFLFMLQTSVLVAMAAKTFRRSLKKQREDTEARRQSASAPSPSSDVSSAVTDAAPSMKEDELKQHESSVESPGSDEEAIRPVEIAAEADVRMTSIGTQGSVMSRVFQKQTSQIESDESGLDSQDICLEEKKEGVEQFSSRDI